MAEVPVCRVDLRYVLQYLGKFRVQFKGPLYLPVHYISGPFICRNPTQASQHYSSHMKAIKFQISSLKEWHQLTKNANKNN